MVDQGAPFDITQVVRAAGASYVAKWSTYHVVELTKSIKDAITHKGFSFVEVLSQCPTQQRRIFDLRGPVDSLPPRILDMFSESAVVRDKPDRGGYVYAVPKASPEETLKQVKAMEGVETRIVDHMAYGRVVRVDTKFPDAVHGKLLELGSVSEVKDHLEGKIELGVFEKRTRPEFTDALQEIIRKARGG